MNAFGLLLGFGIGLILAATGLPAEEASSKPSFESFQEKAKERGATFELPDFETSPDAVRDAIQGAIQEANAKLDTIGEIPPDQVTFANTVEALDQIVFEADRVANRIGLLKETSPDPEVREAATQMIKEYRDWAVELDYREDVYEAIQAYAQTQPELEGECEKLLKETLRDYRRAGLDLPEPKRNEIRELRQKLSRLSTDFSSNITQARHPLTFTREELAGLPESFLENSQVRTGDDEYTILANVTWHFTTVLENAEKEETRRKVQTARFNLAKEENIPLLAEIVGLRETIASKLGYPSWADYRTEIRMAGDAATARRFLERLKEGLEPKFEEELAEFRKLKAQETEQPDPTLHIWDWRYYSNRLKKERYAVDSEALRAYFPMRRTLEGMFHLFERLFDLNIRQVTPPETWADGVELYVVSEGDTDHPLGAFYLDLFPREGKYNHFAQFGIIPGKELPSGSYQCPVVALVCNFPSPTSDKPSLLTHDHVETLFHEFGHALHSILTKARYQRFSGTNVPRDFVEAPSQMLESWVWEKEVLDQFAGHYQDPSRKIPAETLDQMEEARLATIATWYRRQIAFGLIDLTLHEADPPSSPNAIAEQTNRILETGFLPVPEGSAFVAYFGHLTGYDAGYYGYAWADAIAADMETVFKEAPEGYFDQDAGRRLRHKIYEPGGAREAEAVVRDFLGRPRSLDPFLQSIGIPSTSN